MEYDVEDEPLVLDPLLLEPLPLPFCEPMLGHGSEPLAWGVVLLEPEPLESLPLELLPPLLLLPDVEPESVPVVGVVPDEESVPVVGVVPDDESVPVVVEVAVELGSDDWAKECCATTVVPTPARARRERLAPPMRRRRWRASLMLIDAAP